MLHSSAGHALRLRYCLDLPQTLGCKLTFRPEGPMVHLGACTAHQACHELPSTASQVLPVRYSPDPDLAC